MLRLKSMGALSLTRDEVVLAAPGPTRRRLAFLAVLACSGSGAGVSRDRLLALFWPERTDAQARNALKQLTFALRRDLNAPDLLLGGTELRLNPEVISADVSDIIDAAALGEHERVVSSYAGPLLDGVHLADAPEFEAWLDSERRRLASLFRASAVALAESAAANGRDTEQLRYLMLLAHHEPLDSATATEIVAALERMGRLTDALRYAQDYESIVKRELDTGLDPSLLATVRELRDRIEQGASTVAARATPVGESAVAGDGRSPAHLEGRHEALRTVSLHPRQSRARAWFGPLLVTLLAVIIAEFAWSNRRRALAESPPPVTARLQVFVLPFVVTTTDTASIFIAQMATERVDALLEQLGDVSVIRRAPVSGEIPGVLIRGRYQHTASSGTIAVEAHFPSRPARSETIVTSIPLGAGLADSLGRIAERVQAVVASVTPRSDEIPMFDRSAPPANYASYALFRAGLEGYRHDDCRGARELFAAAVLRDPAFSMAAIYAARSAYCAGDFVDAANRLRVLRGATLRPYDRAYVLVLAARFDGDWSAYEKAAMELLGLAPGSEFALATAVGASFRAGDFLRADSLIRNGHLPIRPDDAGYFSLTYHALRDHGRELRDLDSLLVQAPGDDELLGDEAFALAALRRIPEAENRLARLKTEAGRPIGEWIRQTAAEFAVHDQPAEAARLYHRAVEWYGAEPASATWTPDEHLGFAMALLGDGQLKLARSTLQTIDTAGLGELNKVSVVGAAGLANARLGERHVAALTDAWLAGRPLLYAHGYPYIWRSRIALEGGDTARAVAYLRAALQHGFPVYDPEGPYDALHRIPDLRSLLTREGVIELVPVAAAPQRAR